ncbi:hypothetical protein C8Q76DRAFT_258214 [Earliella scabrosa]|nr:hypothetical protein C8Q76DRAFT_258214 [Earliella scabrosa]
MDSPASPQSLHSERSEIQSLHSYPHSEVQSLRSQSDVQSVQSVQLYTIIVRGVVFELSYSQISYDSPNYFTTCFTSGFSEAQERTVRLDRHPALFAIIVDYLSGYPILPLSTRAIPSSMDTSTVLRYLLADADFYELQGLTHLLSTPIPKMDIRWAGFSNKVLALEDVLKGKLPEDVLKTDKGALIVKDTRLDVLVHARNLVVKIILSQTPDNSSVFFGTPVLLKQSFFMDIIQPTSPAASRDHQPTMNETGMCAVLRVKYSHDEGTITVDGKDTSVWSCRHGHPLRWQTHEPRDIGGGFDIWTHDAYTFWADELLLHFPDHVNRSSTTGSSYDSTATLITARLLSMPGILKGISSPMSQDCM